jgi:hypothetical protein
MKSVLPVVLSLLSVVRSADAPGLLYVRQGGKDYVPCGLTPVPYPVQFCFIFFSGPCRMEVLTCV